MRWGSNYWLLGGAFLVVIVVATVLLLLGARASGRPAAAVPAAPTKLPGLMTGPSPWPNNTAQLTARLNTLGFPHFDPDTTPLHIHQHLDLIVNGRPVAVPANVGISFSPNVISVVHTEDKSGIIHVESPTVRPYYLGQFFDVWGLRFTSTCLGSYCSNAKNTLTIYANGVKYNGDPRQLRLTDLQEITVVYGPAGATPSPLPSTYNFPADL